MIRFTMAYSHSLHKNYILCKIQHIYINKYNYIYILQNNRQTKKSLFDADLKALNSKVLLKPVYSYCNLIVYISYLNQEYIFHTC